MHVTNNKLKISKRHRLNIVSGDSFHPGGKCRQENSSSGRCCGNQNSRMKHKHIITLMPFQTRLPQQVLTTTTHLSIVMNGIPTILVSFTPHTYIYNYIYILYIYLYTYVNIFIYTHIYIYVYIYIGIPQLLVISPELSPAHQMS